MIQQLAIMKTLKKVEVLSTVISAVNSYFGYGGDAVAAKKQMETLEKNFGVLSALKKKMGGGDEEIGMKGGELVANPMQVEGVLGGEIGDIEMKSVNKKHLLQAASFNTFDINKGKEGKGATGPLRKNKQQNNATMLEPTKDEGSADPSRPNKNKKYEDDED